MCSVTTPSTPSLSLELKALSLVIQNKIYTSRIVINYACIVVYYLGLAS